MTYFKFLYLEEASINEQEVFKYLSKKLISPRKNYLSIIWEEKIKIIFYKQTAQTTLTISIEFYNELKSKFVFVDDIELFNLLIKLIKLESIQSFWLQDKYYEYEELFKECNNYVFAKI